MKRDLVKIFSTFRGVESFQQNVRFTELPATDGCLDRLRRCACFYVVVDCCNLDKLESWVIFTYNTLMQHYDQKKITGLFFKHLWLTKLFFVNKPASSCFWLLRWFAHSSSNLTTSEGNELLARSTARLVCKIRLK